MLQARYGVDSCPWDKCGMDSFNSTHWRSVVWIVSIVPIGQVWYGLSQPTNGPTNIAGQSRIACDLKVRTGEHLSNEHLHILTTVKLTALSLQVHVPGEECCFQEC